MQIILIHIPTITIRRCLGFVSIINFQERRISMTIITSDGFEVEEDEFLELCEELDVDPDDVELVR